MRKDQIRTEGDALLYLTDCVMATVCELAMRKRRPKHEYARQISMAQFAVDKIRLFGLNPKGTRIEDLGEGDVASWARTFEPEIRFPRKQA